MGLHWNNYHRAHGFGNKVVESVAKCPFHQDSGFAVKNYDFLVTSLNLRPDHHNVTIPTLLYLRVLLVLRVLRLVAQQRSLHDISVCLYRPELLWLVEIVIRGYFSGLFNYVLHNARAHICVQFQTR